MEGLKKHGPLIICLLVCISAGGRGSYIWVKAVAAQILLRNAWSRTASTQHHRPWPWADTHPVGRLLSQDHDVDLVILSGVSGHSLAFGPGHQPGSAHPGSNGHVVLAAHRDTHFRFLKDVKRGDELWLQSPHRNLILYEVSDLMVVDKNDTHHLDQSRHGMLTLVTCYPFDSAFSRGRQRYLVQLVRRHQRGSTASENRS